MYKIDRCVLSEMAVPSPTLDLKKRTNEKREVWHLRDAAAAHGLTKALQEEHNICDVRCQVLAVVARKIIVFWYAMPYHPLCDVC
jgi:hypothetical protein